VIGAGAAARAAALAATTALLLLQGACSRPPEAHGTAIRDVTVIDAVNGVREHQIVHYDGDRIVAVYDVGEERPPAAEVIDGRGGYLIPGLWDMHVHLTYDAALTPAMPAMFLYYGVTSVRDTGGLLEQLEPVVSRMRAPGALAPRVFFSGPLLDGPLVVYDGVSRPHIGIAVPTAAAARDTVARLAAAGVDFIKIYELVEPPVFEALVDAARQLGLPIAAHVPLSMTAPRVAPEVDSLEHLRNIELACAADAPALLDARRAIMAAYQPGSGYELRALLHGAQRLYAVGNYDAARCAVVLEALRHTIQVPTLRLNAFALAPPFARDDWQDALRLLPADRRAAWAAPSGERTAADTTFAEWSLKLTGDMNARGIPVGAGTDTPIAFAIPGYSLHSELEMLVRAGLSPMQALAAATVQPAHFFGLDSRMGAIEAGRRADLVLLTADPLEDIANTRRIDLVVAAGRTLPRAGLREQLEAAINAQ